MRSCRKVTTVTGVTSQIPRARLTVHTIIFDAHAAVGSKRGAPSQTQPRRSLPGCGPELAVSFAIEGSELVLAFKMMIVANWMVEGNAFKCVPGGWSSDGTIVVKNVVQAKSISLRQVCQFVQFLIRSQSAEEASEMGLSRLL